MITFSCFNWRAISLRDEARMAYESAKLALMENGEYKPYSKWTKEEGDDLTKSMIPCMLLGGEEWFEEHKNWFKMNFKFL